MSRSRKRHPFLKDGGRSHRAGKVRINRRTRRRSSPLPTKGNFARRNGGRLYEERAYFTEQDAIRAWADEEAEHVSCHFLHDRYGTLDRWLDHWRKRYLGK